MDAALALIALTVAAAAALVLERPQPKAWAVLAAIALEPIVLVAHVWDAEELQGLRDRPALVAGAAVAVAIAVAAVAALCRRRPGALALLAIAALPIRVPMSDGGTTVSLLVALYVVITGGAIAYVAEQLRPVRSLDDRVIEADPPTRGLEWALSAALVLYAAQATYSSDSARALADGVVFLVPLTVLFVLLRRMAWTATLVRRCGAVLVAVAVVLVATAIFEKSADRLLVNPQVVAADQLGDVLRGQSLFLDPDAFGRFLVVAIVVVAAWALWARRARDVAAAAVIAAVLWSGLMLTLSQSSLVALLAGLAVLAGLRWSVRRGLLVTAALVTAAAAVVLAAGALDARIGEPAGGEPGAGARWALVEGGARLTAERPIGGWGSGAFVGEFRRAEHASAHTAATAAGVAPLRTAVEQGVAGVAAFLAVLWLALSRLFGRAHGSPPRAAVAACFAAVVAHTLLEGAFLEDPLTWILLGAGSGLSFAANRHRRRPGEITVHAKARERVAAPA